MEQYFFFFLFSRSPEKEKNPNCKMFNIKDFGPESRSIFYGEANGRFGNQLLG